MTGWGPAIWDDIGAAGFAIFIAVFFIWALVRGWVVPGYYHRDSIKRLEERSHKDQETIELLSKAVTERQVEDQVTTRMLSTIRDLIAKEGAS